MIAIYLFFVSIALLIACFSLYVLMQGLLNIPPYVPSRHSKVKQVFSELKLENKRFLDVGSGDGSVVLQASRHGAIATGVEINPFLIFISRVFTTSWRTLFTSRTSEKAHPKPTFIWKSFWEIDFTDYDIIYTYLFPETMHKLEEKMFSQAKKGTLIVSNTFKFKDHKPWKVLSENFYIYKV